MRYALKITILIIKERRIHEQYDIIKFLADNVVCIIIFFIGGIRTLPIIRFRIVDKDVSLSTIYAPYIKTEAQL